MVEDAFGGSGKQHNVIIEAAGSVGNGDQSDSGKPTEDFAGNGSIDPRTIDAEREANAAGEPVRKRRGRPKRSETAGSQEKTKSPISLKAEPVNDPDTIAATLMLTHSGLAFAFRTPELEIDKQEADVLTQSLLKVSRHYPNVAMPAKTLDWMNLIGVLGACYGGRIVRIKERKKKDNAEKQAQQHAA